MKNKIHTRLGAGITALALTCTLGLSGCSTNDRYTYTSKNDGSYGLKNIYVNEVKNNISKQNEIYIARKTIIKHNNTTTQDHLSYVNIPNNLEIYNTKSEESKHNLEIYEETQLFDYLLAYDLIKSRYYYDDMLETYNIIKENYEYNKDKTKKKTKEN